MNLDLLCFLMFLFIYLFIYFLILTVFNYVCVSAFGQSHLDPWRSKSALIIIIIILKISLKQLHFQGQKSESREYTNRKHEYWQEDIFNKRQDVSNSESAFEEDTVCGVVHFTVAEIKGKKIEIYN